MRLGVVGLVICATARRSPNTNPSPTRSLALISPGPITRLSPAMAGRRRVANDDDSEFEAESNPSQSTEDESEVIDDVAEEDDDAVEDDNDEDDDDVILMAPVRAPLHAPAVRRHARVGRG